MRLCPACRKDVSPRPWRSFGTAAIALAAWVVTVSAAPAERVSLTDDFGYGPQVVRDLPTGSDVDARSAAFRVANSGTALPSTDRPCDGGALPVNPYPLQIRASPGVTLHGGLFAGEVPLASDWQDTYCNSAALALRDSPGAVVEGLRMRRVWDAVRMSENSGAFLFQRSWIGETRDDCIENDHLNGGIVEDVLLDGCFSGLSMRPPKDVEDRPDGGPVVMRGLLMRMQSYLYKGELRQGVPLKIEQTGPAIEIHDSIIAMDNPLTVSGSRLKIGWARIGRCSGNLLLWMADTPWPKGFGTPPPCFRLVQGAEARTLWQEARRNWIDCHPDSLRFVDDPASTPTACLPGTYGAGDAPPR